MISSLKRSLSNNKQSRGMRIDVSAGRSFRCCAKVQEAQVMDCPAIMYYIVHTTIISKAGGSRFFCLLGSIKSQI